MKILNKLLDERKKAARQERVDFIDLLIDVLTEEKPAMSENFALNLIFLLLFAGFETTSSGITAAVKFLTDNPKVLQELTVSKSRSTRRNTTLSAQFVEKKQLYNVLKVSDIYIQKYRTYNNISLIILDFKFLENIFIVFL